MASNGGAPAAAGASGGPGGDHPDDAEIEETDDLMPQLEGWCHENQGRFPGIINADTNKIDIDVLLHDADAYVHFLVFACSRMSNSDQQLRVPSCLVAKHIATLRSYIMSQALELLPTEVVGALEGRLTTTVEKKLEAVKAELKEEVKKGWWHPPIPAAQFNGVSSEFYCAFCLATTLFSVLPLASSLTVV